MALINCPECKTEVSDTAFDCPKCAATLKKPTRTFFGKLIKLIFIAFNIFMLVWAIGIFSSSGSGFGRAIAIEYMLTRWVVGDIIIGILFILTKPSKH